MSGREESHERERGTTYFCGELRIEGMEDFVGKIHLY